MWCIAAGPLWKPDTYIRLRAIECKQNTQGSENEASLIPNACKSWEVYLLATVIRGELALVPLRLLKGESTTSRKNSKKQK